MTENEMTEEMGIDMCGIREVYPIKSCDECTRGVLKDWKSYCVYINEARHLYKLGYRKIPDGAVVLAKEDYDNMINLTDCAVCEHKEIERARKESARGILSWLRAEIQSQQFNYTVGLGILEQIIAYKAKELGVELE